MLNNTIQIKRKINQLKRKCRFLTCLCLILILINIYTLATESKAESEIKPPATNTEIQILDNIPLYPPPNDELTNLMIINHESL